MAGPGERGEGERSRDSDAAADRGGDAGEADGQAGEGRVLLSAAGEDRGVGPERCGSRVVHGDGDAGGDQGGVRVLGGEADAEGHASGAVFSGRVWWRLRG